MNRRTVIKNLILITGGAVVLPSCRTDRASASIPLKNIRISGAEEQLMAEMGETLIPAGKLPGAKDTYTQLYALKILDDCYEKEAQEGFVRGLKEADRMAQEKFDKGFVAAAPAQRAQLVAELEQRRQQDRKEDVDTFYSTLKSLTIRGYLSSKYVMTNVLKYELVPGRFLPCVPVKVQTNQV